MTWTLAPDDIRDARRRTLSRRTVRESRGSVYYPQQFRDLARHTDVRHPGSVHPYELREPAREPGSPISRLCEWYDRHEWVIAAPIGLGILGGVWALWRIAFAVAEWVTR